MNDRAADRLYLVDASIYVFRAWHSVEFEVVDREGFPVHAAYGFCGFLCTLLEQTRAQHIAICFDESLEHSFRHEILPEYKANREPPPLELRRQFSHCRSIAEALGIDCLSHDRYEADDLIGTLARHHRVAGLPISIVSSDKDLTQLLEPGDELWDFARQRRVPYAGVLERYGVRPEQMADYLALTGDPVDNIPGVPGIGARSAAALLQHFGDLDALLNRVDEVGFLRLRGARGLAERLRTHRDTAVLSRRLTEICCDAPLPEPAPDLRRRGVETDTLADLFDYLGFGRLLRQRCAALR